MSLFSVMLGSILPSSISSFLNLSYSPKTNIGNFFATIQDYNLYGLFLHGAIEYSGLGGIVGSSCKTLCDLGPESISQYSDTIENIFADKKVSDQFIGYELAGLLGQYSTNIIDHKACDMMGIEGGTFYLARSTFLGASLGSILDKNNFNNIFNDYEILSQMGMKNIGAIIGFISGAILSIYDWYYYVPPEQKSYLESATDYAGNISDATKDYMVSAKNSLYDCYQNLSDWWQVGLVT